MVVVVVYSGNGKNSVVLWLMVSFEKCIHLDHFEDLTL